MQDLKIFSSMTEKCLLDNNYANVLCSFYFVCADCNFGLSKEEVFDGRKSGLKVIYIYMDPDYMPTNKFTNKSGAYSFGIILFELIIAVNPVTWSSESSSITC